MPSKKTFLPFLILNIGLMLCLQASQSAFAQQLELVVQTGHTDSVDPNLENLLYFRAFENIFFTAKNQRMPRKKENHLRKHANFGKNGKKLGVLDRKYFKYSQQIS